MPFYTAGLAVRLWDGMKLNSHELALHIRFNGRNASLYNLCPTCQFY
jgi:hypothetical protein